MYMTTEDFISLANESREIQRHSKISSIPGRIGQCVLEFLKHDRLLRKLRATGCKQWAVNYRQRLTLSANAFPRKACYPYGAQAMGEPKATGRDVWAHVGKRG